MAKDGTNRGGPRPGTGPKRKPLADKITDGTAKGTLVMPDDFPEPTDIEGEDIPPVRDYLKAKQKNGSELCAEEIFRAVFMSAEYPLLLLTNRLSKDRTFAVRVLDCLCGLTAECVRAALGAENTSDKAKELSDRISANRLTVLQKNVQHAREVLNINVNLSFYSTWLSGVLRSTENGG